MGVAYPASVMLEARRLRETTDWGYQRIGNRVGVSGTTVRKWCDEKAAEKDRARSRAAQVRRPRKLTRPPSPEFLLARAQLLHEHGVSFGAIATLFGLDYRVDVADDSVRRYVAAGRWPRHPRRRRV
jgi:hypothetical protein